MMDLEQVKKDIEQWVIDFLEVPHESLGGLPACPYARRARLDRTYDVRLGNDLYTDLVSLSSMNGWQVIIFAYDPSTYESDLFSRLVNDANMNFLLNQDLICLEDHPKEREIVNGLCMNQGTYALAMVQSLSELNEKASSIAKTGFYDNWPEDYLQQVFRHRIDPRQS